MTTALFSSNSSGFTRREKEVEEKMRRNHSDFQDTSMRPQGTFLNLCQVFLKVSKIFLKGGNHYQVQSAWSRGTDCFVKLNLLVMNCTCGIL